MDGSKILALVLALTMIFTVLAAFPMSAGAASYDDASFFAKLNYSAYPGLAQVKAAVDKADYDSAKAELLKYFKQRHSEGQLTGSGVSDADEFYGMAVLPMRNILTGPYEFDMWQGEFTVTSSEYADYTTDVTERVASELNNGAVSFMLFAGDKQQYPVLVQSKESESAPKLKVTYTRDGATATAVITADNDTYISSQNTSATYGTETVLYIKEDGSGSDSTGTNTRRTYINFPLDKVANSTIDSAELVVSAAYATDCTTGDKDVLVINVGDTMWSENSLTWGGTRGSIYSYQDAENPTWNASAPNADTEYHNVTSRFWFGKPMAYEYLSYLEDPDGYNASHPYSDVYPGAEFGPKLVSLMSAFASQMSYGYTRTLETGERLNRWVDIVDAFLETDVFDTRLDDFVKILDFMWGDCDWLNGKSITDGSAWWSNWRIVANAGFFKAVEYFPEFSNHDTWREKVEYNVEYTLDLLYNDDMSFTEAGPSYNAWCVKLFGDCAKAANMSGNPMSDEFMTKLRYAARNALESYYPNGWDSNIGDSNYRDQMYYFEMLDKLFDGKDSIISAYVNGSDEGAEYFSSFYPKTNSAYLRDSWDPDETVYINFTNNPNDGHYHPDSNQVLMFAYGQPLLVDSGRYSYSSTNSIYNELRYASAHNTVEAVGVSMGAHSAAASAGTMDYTTNPVFDFVTNEQHGYSGTNHTRNVLYLHGEDGDSYALVTDYVEGSNADQEYRQNWHFLPSSNAAVSDENIFTDTYEMENGPIAKTNFYGKANITIASAGADNAQIRSGYHSADYGLVANSEYASFSKTGQNVKFDTVLYPQRAGESVKIALADLSDDENTAVQIMSEDSSVGGYYYVNNNGAESGGVADYVTDGKMLLAFGNHLGMAGGTYLKTDYGPIITSPAKVDSIVVDFDSDSKTMYVSGDNLALAKDEASAIKLDYYGNTVDKLYLNGEEVPVVLDDSGNIVSIASTNLAGDPYTLTGENLVPDPGFEDAEGNFSWGTWESPNGSNGYFKDSCEDWFYKVNRDTNESALYQSGSISAEDYALGTRWNDGATGLCSMANFIPVEAGKTYAISFDYKHVSGADTGYIITGFKADRADYNDGTVLFTPASATTEWQTASYVFTAPEDGYVYFHFRWLGDGNNTGNGPYWYFDNFSVAEAVVNENPYDVPTTVTVVSQLSSGETITGETIEAEPGTFYSAQPQETVVYGGKTYVINRQDSSLTIKVEEGANVITVYYDATTDSTVTVKYADEDGNAIKDDEIVSVPYGVTIDGESVGVPETIVDGETAYILKEVLGYGETADGSEKTVVAVYEAFGVETATADIARGDSLKCANGDYTNMSTETGSEYAARLMLDNRWNKRAGVFGVDIESPVIQATVSFNINDNSSTNGPLNLIDVTDILGKSWSRGNVSGLDLSGAAAATGYVSGSSVIYDITDLVNAGSSEFGLITGGSNEYIILDSENTSNPPVVTIKTIKDKQITAIAPVSDIEVPYAGTVTMPATVKATADGKEIELNVISVDSETIDTRTPGTTEVTATVEIPEHYALASDLTDQIKFNVTVLPEPEAVVLEPLDTVSAISGQNQDGVFKFGGEITRTAVFDFDITLNQPKDTLLAINNSGEMTSNNFFGNSSIFMLINADGLLKVRNGSTNDNGVTLELNTPYHISVTTDVEADTFTAVISDAEGNVLHTAENYAYRKAVDSLDCLVAIDNGGVNNAYTVENFKVETNNFVPDVKLSATPELRILEEGAQLGLAFTAKAEVNLNLVEEAGFEYGAYIQDENGNYVIEQTDLEVDFEQISTDMYRLVIKGISDANSVRRYAARPYVTIGGEKYYGEVVADSLYNVLADSIVNGQGTAIEPVRLAAANKLIAYVGYRQADDDKFPGQAAAEDKLYEADGTIKQAYADMGISADNAGSEDIELLDAELVEIEFTDPAISDTVMPGDISMELDFVEKI